MKKYRKISEDCPNSSNPVIVTYEYTDNGELDNRSWDLTNFIACSNLNCKLYGTNCLMYKDADKTIPCNSIN